VVIGCIWRDFRRLMAPARRIGLEKRNVVSRFHPLGPDTPDHDIMVVQTMDGEGLIFSDDLSLSPWEDF
jgi:hypothetical protein